MTKIAVNKRKIINDPVHGFISFPYDINFQLIEHPLIQRLRRIRQLGLTNFVYPGANHSRFQHALGSAYLMGQAIEVIRSKGHPVSNEEEEGAINAMLLHDVGHGPFSHSLESSIISGMEHESLSLQFMKQLNKEFEGGLQMAIDIFTNTHPRKFLHQLVSGQLDMDRMDYLKRDSFFTGVTEGVIGSERIIKMLNISGDELVVDSKGIYSTEKFLIARRLMFWQVYLHKTVVSAENLLIRSLQRAKYLSRQGHELMASPALKYFLSLKEGAAGVYAETPPEVLGIFQQLDDTDIISALKLWAGDEDKVLSLLCSSLINRRLFKIEISREKFSEDRVQEIRSELMKKYQLKPEESEYLVHTGILTNNTYNFDDERIKLMKKEGTILDITEASDIFNLNALSQPVQKYFLTYPKEIHSHQY